jgi:4-alpha-glucanotransferase
VNPADLVEAEYVDAFRVRRRVPRTHRDAVVRAMGLDPNAAGEAGAPEPVRLVRRAAEAVSPPAALVLEDGTALGSINRLPRDLPHGYHRLERDDGSQLLLVAPRQTHAPAGLSWGWAVQLYAARSTQSWGIGDLADLRQLAEWCGASGGAFLFVNPLHAPNPAADPEPSPYYTSTRRFLNLLYLRIEALDGAELVAQPLARLAAAGRALNAQRRIDRERVQALKLEALELVWGALPAGRRAARTRDGSQALRSWATFAALGERYGPAWRRWPEALRRPDSTAVAEFAAAHGDRIAFHEWLQGLLDDQLRAAAGAGVGLIADLPIGFDPSGFDAWSWQDDLSPSATIGAPPDRFNPAGQDWGLPPFVPHRLRASQYRPFIATVRACLRHAAGLRIDHALGLFRVWWVPSGATPEMGAYVRSATDEMLAILAIESERAGAVILGEDLGTVGAGVRRRLRSAGLLSTRIAWFERDLSRIPSLASAAITNHDLPTVAGAWSGADLAELAALSVPHDARAQRGLLTRLAEMSGLGPAAPAEEVAVAAHRTLAASPAAMVVGTLEDASGVRERVNVPGTTARQRPNWSLALPEPIESLAASRLAGALASAMTEGRSTARARSTTAPGPQA